MKKLMAVGLVVVITLIASPALADYAGGSGLLDRHAGYFSGNGGEFTLENPTVLGYAHYAAVAKGTNSFQTFCVETTEHVAIPRTYNFVVSTTWVGDAEGGSHSVDTKFNLAPETAWLYQQFATGNLAGYNYTVVDGRATSAAALQSAIWHLQSGQAGGVHNSFVDDAETFILANPSFGIGNVRILNVTYPSGALAQDQLYLLPTSVPVLPVPVPGAVLLGVIGLGIVGWVKRRVL